MTPAPAELQRNVLQRKRQASLIYFQSSRRTLDVLLRWLRVHQSLHMEELFIFLAWRRWSLPCFQPLFLGWVLSRCKIALAAVPGSRKAWDKLRTDGAWATGTSMGLDGRRMCFEGEIAKMGFRGSCQSCSPSHTHPPPAMPQLWASYSY